MADRLKQDSDNLGNASVTYTDSIPDQSEAMLGRRFSDTLYSQSDCDYGDMHSNFETILPA